MEKRHLMVGHKVKADQDPLRVNNRQARGNSTKQVKPHLKDLWTRMQQH